MPNLIPLGNGGRRNRGMNTMTALVIGAGVGIAAWQMVRSRNNGSGGSNNNQLPKMAKTILNAFIQ